MSHGLAKKYLEKTREDYKIIANKFSDTRFLPWPEMVDLARIYVRDDSSVLDVGCGNGRLYDVFKNRPLDYLGIDPVPELLNKARQKFPQAKFIKGDALNLDILGEQKFEYVFLIAVLHQIPSHELQLKALQNIASVLKPGGYLIMENWNFLQRRYWRYWFIKYLIDRNLPFRDLLISWKAFDYESSPGLKQMWRYYHAFTLKELERLVKAANLKLIEQYYVKKGQKVNALNGFNIVTVAQK